MYIVVFDLYKSCNWLTCTPSLYIYKRSPPPRVCGVLPISLYGTASPGTPPMPYRAPPLLSTALASVDRDYYTCRCRLSKRDSLPLRPSLGHSSSDALQQIPSTVAGAPPPLTPAFIRLQLQSCRPPPPHPCWLAPLPCPLLRTHRPVSSSSTPMPQSPSSLTLLTIN